MNKRDTKVTTIEFDAQDQECIQVVQEYLQSLKPIYNVSRRVAISWALRKAASEITGKADGSAS